MRLHLNSFLPFDHGSKCSKVICSFFEANVSLVDRFLIFNGSGVGSFLIF